MFMVSTSKLIFDIYQCSNQKGNYQVTYLCFVSCKALSKWTEMIKKVK